MCHLAQTAPAAKSSRTPTNAHHDLPVGELELNLRCLHGLRSHGGSHWEWPVLSRPECGLHFALFLILEKSAKNHSPACPGETEEDAAGETLEGLHQPLENQRSAPQSAQNCVPEEQAALLSSVQEENLEDRKFALHDLELECQRSAP